MTAVLIWLSKNGQRTGPMSVADAQAHIDRGGYDSGDLAWVVGAPTWTSIAECSHLAPHSTPNTPSAQPSLRQATPSPMAGWLPHADAAMSWPRFAARYLDRSLIAMLGSFVTLVTMPSALTTHAAPLIFLRYALLSWLVSLVVHVVYETWAIHLFGATFGKYCLGIRVQGADNALLPLGQSLKRAVLVLSFGSAFLIPLLSFIAYTAAYNALEHNTQGPLWDRASGAVVHAKTNVRLQRILVCLVCLLVLGASWGNAVVLPLRQAFLHHQRISAHKALQK